MLTLLQAYGIYYGGRLKFTEIYFLVISDRGDRFLRLFSGRAIEEADF